MNINLKPVSDSPNTKSVQSGSDSASTLSEGAPSESGGFFAKLSAMVGGLMDGGETKGNEGASTETSVKAGEKSENSEGNAKAIKGGSADESADEMLKQVSESDASTESTKSAKSSGDDADMAAVKGDVDKQKQSAESNRRDEAAKTVSESDELLGRLNESNNALKDKDGKPLPQQSEISDSQHSEVTNMVAQGASSEGNKVRGDVDNQTDQEVALNAQKSQSVDKNHSVQQEQTDAIPDSIKPFIENEQAAASGEPLSDESLTEMSQQTVGKGNNQTSVSEEYIVAAVMAKHGVNGPQSGEGNTQISAKSGIEGEQVLSGDSAIDVEATDATQAANSAQQLGSQQFVSERTASQPLSDGTTNAQNKTGLSEQEAAAAASLGAGAIAWNNPAAVEQANLEQAALQTGRSQGQLPQTQAAVAASVQQALNQSPQSMSSQTMSSQSMSPQMVDKLAVENMASAMPADLTQNQLQQMIAVNGAIPPGVHGQANNQAALKAALGLKAANGINQGQSVDPKEAALAQQIAQATGQQLPPAARAEAAQAQVPLPLSRDLAGEQVAERVQMMMSKNLKNIDIRLDPPELGRMQIRMNMNGDNTAVHFTVTNQQARDVIEQSMPRLREMLAQQGVQLGDTSVQQQNSGQQQGQYATNENQGSGRGLANNMGDSDENIDSDTKVDLNVTTKRDGISYYA
ncbi:flagellar hook-length control protein FliK [Vibrio sp. YMD68]|uniref:flagellar hook-length control protein FliK n=1 Tax=Vibrio sp. YMD68 TaxID=3042300 RepID=UPI00249A0037|nr:flagellar hook-length control protein FliK [Vibrio sp. YMD68]WGV99540.1 flagellar hook-length control protein FliK [Vibrio sp. YMD68]